MKPVQIQTSGQLVIFKSQQAFLDLLGYSKTYTKTAHYKRRHGEETPQQLWNRVPNARAKLEQLMAQYSPTIDPEIGMKSYRHGKVIVCPVGYVPPPLREHVTIEAVNGEPAPVATGMTLNELLAARICEEIDRLVEQCAAAEGEEAADQLRASITGVSVAVTAVSGDPNRWLVRVLNQRLFGIISN